MIKIVDISGKVLFVNIDSIESYDPKDCVVKLSNGHEVVIDAKESNVDALTDGYNIRTVQEHDYLKQFLDNVVTIVKEEGADKALVIVDKGNVDNEIVEKVNFVMDYLYEKLIKVGEK